MEKTVLFICSAALVFIGAVLYDPANGKRAGKPLTDFQKFLFGTGFTYIMLIFWETSEFFWDYYVRGSALQKYNCAPSENDLFIKLFGLGKSGEAQFPVWDIDMDLLYCVAGAALGGAALLVCCAVRNKKNNTPENGLFFGMAEKTPSFGEYVKNEVAVFKEQISPLEYLSWWVLRFLLVLVLVKRIKAEGFSTEALQFAANLSVTFIIPALRALFFKKLFFGNINFRVQTFIDVIVFLGNFLGIGLGYTGNIYNYDKFVHMVSGAVAVAIGALLIEGMRNGAFLPRKTKTAASFGFSCVVIVLWEIFEFIADFVIEGCENQNWSYNPSAKMLFYRIFGYGAQNPGQLAVLDTDLDIVCAVFGSALAAAAVYAMLSAKEKRSVVKISAEVKV